MTIRDSLHLSWRCVSTVAVGAPLRSSNGVIAGNAILIEFLIYKQLVSSRVVGQVLLQLSALLDVLFS